MGSDFARFRVLVASFGFMQKPLGSSVASESASWSVLTTPRLGANLLAL